MKSSSTCEDLKCDLKTMCAIVQWDWECVIHWDFYSSFVINPLPGSG
jgi:hypothetical protein